MRWLLFSLSSQRCFPLHLAFLHLLLFSITLTLFPASAEILEVYPNPFDEKLEYVKVRVNSSAYLTDGEGFVNFSLPGIHYAAKDPKLFKKRYGVDAVPFGKKFALSNSGDELRLYEDGRLVDMFDYTDVYRDEGLIYYRSEKGRWDFRYDGWSNFSSVSDVVSGQIVVTPADLSFSGKEAVMTSYILIQCNFDFEKGILLLDASPTGGLPESSCLEELQNKDNFSVYFLSSPVYRNFHYKFGVIDGSKVIITTENWRWNKRGYVVVFESSKVAKYLREVARNDLQFRSEAISGSGYVWKGKSRVNLGNSHKSFEFAAEVEVFVLPDYDSIFDFIASATERLYIEAPYMDFQWFEGFGVAKNSDTSPLLNSILRAARNGADVVIVLSNTERNREVAEFIENTAEKEGVEIQVSLTDLKLHGKAVVADDRLLITSANLNKYGLKLNREIGIIINSRDVSDFVAEIIRKDASGSSRENGNPLIPLIAFVALIIAARTLLRGKKLP
jgi:hypothetical protein